MQYYFIVIVFCTPLATVLYVLQKVSSEVNDLSSCFMSIAAGKIGKVLFYFAFKSPETVLTDANAGYNSNRISYFCN